MRGLVDPGEVGDGGLDVAAARGDGAAGAAEDGARHRVGAGAGDVGEADGARGAGYGVGDVAEAVGDVDDLVAARHRVVGGDRVHQGRVRVGELAEGGEVVEDGVEDVGREEDVVLFADRAAEVGGEGGDEAGGVARDRGEAEPHAGGAGAAAEGEDLVEGAGRRGVEAVEEVGAVARDLGGGVGGEAPDAAAVVVGAGGGSDALGCQHGVERGREERAEVEEAAGRFRPAAEGVVDDEEVVGLGEDLDRGDAEVAQAAAAPLDLDPGMRGGEARDVGGERLVAARVVPGDAAEPGHRHALAVRSTRRSAVVSVADAG